MSDKKVTEEQIDELIANADVETMFWYPKTTLVKVVLPNGWCCIEHSSCVDPDNYDHELGVEICMKRIKDKLWELEGYLLQNEVK